jgi:hypothetical protein
LERHGFDPEHHTVFMLLEHLERKASPVAIHEGWKPMETAPRYGEFIATIEVIHRNISADPIRHFHVLALDDETGEIHADYHQGWDLEDYEAWHPVPAWPQGGYAAPPSPGAAQGMEPVAELRQDEKGGGYVHWLSDKTFDVGTKLYASPPASPAPAREALNNLIEQIAVEWDGCEFDAPGGMIDIGDAIRRKGLPLVAALSPSSPGAQTNDGEQKEGA